MWGTIILWLIIIGAIAVLAVFFIVWNKFSRIYNTDINHAIHRKAVDSGRNSKANLNRRYDVEYEWEEIRLAKNNYNTTYAHYVAVSQLVSLFPLLGILGTVVGLAGSLNGDQTNVANLISGLGTALYTTIAGILAAVVLKAVDSMFIGTLINKIDNQFDDIDAIEEHNALVESLSNDNKE